MKNIITASQLLKAAIVAYFSENIEIKTKRATLIMIPVIVLGALMAYVVNH